MTGCMKEIYDQIIDPCDDYDHIEGALKAGHKIEICTIDQNGFAVQWHGVTEPIRDFPVNRYRILIRNINT